MDQVQKQLQDLASYIYFAAIDAPGSNPAWSRWTFESHMADIRQLWALVRPHLHCDPLQLLKTEAFPEGMLSAFEARDSNARRAAAWAFVRIDLAPLELDAQPFCEFVCGHNVCILAGHVEQIHRV